MILVIIMITAVILVIVETFYNHHHLDLHYCLRFEGGLSLGFAADHVAKRCSHVSKLLLGVSRNGWTLTARRTWPSDGICSLLYLM